MDALATTLQAGARVRLLAMDGDPHPVAVGTCGTVTAVRHFDPPLPASRSQWQDGRPMATQLPAEPITAQVDVDWDDGRTLSVLLPGDRVERVG